MSTTSQVDAPTMVRVPGPDGAVDVPIEVAAAELADVTGAVKDLSSELADLTPRMVELRDALKEAVGIDAPVEIGEGRHLTLTQAKGSRKVHTGLCDQFREQLVAQGVSEPKPPPPPSFTNPGVRDLEKPAIRAKLLAAGVPVNQLVVQVLGEVQVVVTHTEGV